MKILDQSILITLKISLNTHIIWMIFIKNTEDYNPNKNLKILIEFDDMIADML